MQYESSVSKLLSISSASLCEDAPTVSQALLSRCTPELAQEYLKLLESKNGFFSFECALHVFPAGKAASGYDVESWNEPTGWMSGYGDFAKDYLYFAEDVFGEQFSIKDDSVFRFDPETGSYAFMADSIEAWAHLVLEDYHAETGYNLAHEWQTKNGVLDMSKRLIPKTPFILGGEYSLDNLFALDAKRGMELRADIWHQIKDLPPGTKIEIKLTE